MLAAVGLFLGTGCTAAAPSVPVSTAVSGDADAAFERIGDFWRGAYQAAFGSPWVELRGGVRPLDSGAGGDGTLCIATADQITGNAYYCADSDGIVYDTGVLVPVLLDHYGEPGLLASLAHEFGHAVAARSGVADQPAVLRETQADCYAGVFLAEAVPDQLVPAMAPLLDFGDQVGALPTDGTAHGLAVDRAQAVQLGFRDGATACRDISTTSFPLALGRFAADPDRGVRDVPEVPVDAADAALAAPIGQFALATAARLEADLAAGLSPAAAGCDLGRWTGGLFGTVPPDRLGGRLSDPDEALTLLRTRPGSDRELVFGYLDGFAGRAC